MKLSELFNATKGGDKTNLSGGKLPNTYRDDASKANKLPRTKKKDMYGTTSLATGADVGAGDGGGSGGSGGAT